jgi:hypothetical protein
MDTLVHLSFSTLLVIILIALLTGVLLGAALTRPRGTSYR